MNIPGVILAGGQGRRIGGSKPMRLLAGRPLWQHVVGRIEPQVSHLAINAEDAFGGRILLADECPGLGPLSGLLAALAWGAAHDAERVLTVAVDTPFLPRDLVTRLATVPGPIAMAQTSDGLHGTTALWDVTLETPLRQALGRDLRKVTAFADAQGLTPVRFPDTTPPAFFNINTPDDLAIAESWLA